jgi:uncharacterized protein (DUF924 family)
MVKKVLADIHRYWFGDLAASQGTPSPEKIGMWFTVKPETDDHIRQTFGKYIDAAASTEWDLANLSHTEQVALVVLLDQFPRNIYRDSGQAFAYDAKARAIAGELVKGGMERFHLAEQMFLFLPFEHSENLADQDFAVWLFAGHLLAAPEPAKGGVRMAFDFAYKHWDIIKKFGRFPHRNAALGRESTPEELEFLKSGRGF